MTATDIVHKYYSNTPSQKDIDFTFNKTFARFHLTSHEDIIVPETSLFEAAVLYKSPEAEIKWQFQPGQLALAGQTIAIVSGEIKKILQAENTAISFINQLAGLTSLAKCYSELSNKVAFTCTYQSQNDFEDFENNSIEFAGFSHQRFEKITATLFSANFILSCKDFTAEFNEFTAKNTQPKILEFDTPEIFNKFKELPATLFSLKQFSLEQLQGLATQIKTMSNIEIYGNYSTDDIKKIITFGFEKFNIESLKSSHPTAEMTLRIES